MSEWEQVSPPSDGAYVKGMKVDPGVQASRDQASAQIRLAEASGEYSDADLSHVDDPAVLNAVAGRIKKKPQQDQWEMVTPPQRDEWEQVSPPKTIGSGLQSQSFDNQLESNVVAGVKKVAGDTFAMAGAKDPMDMGGNIPGMALGAAKGMVLGGGEFFGKLASYIGLDPTDSTVKHMAEWKTAHPDATFPEELLEYMNAPGLGSKEIKKLRDLLGTSAAQEQGEKAIVAPFSIPGEALGKTIRDRGGSETAAGLAEQFTGLAMAAAPFAKGFKGKGTPKVDEGLVDRIKAAADDVPAEPTEPPGPPRPPLQHQDMLPLSSKVDVPVGHTRDLFLDEQGESRMPVKEDPAREDLLKMAEVEDSWRKKGLSEEAITQQKNDLWDQHDLEEQYKGLKAERDKEGFQDTLFDENRPTAMEDAYKRAQQSLEQDKLKIEPRFAEGDVPIGPQGKGRYSPSMAIPDKLKSWFEDSKVVDEKGEPLQVYHGTSKDKDFSSFKSGQRGSWFTRNPEDASSYAHTNDSQGSTYEGGRFVPTNTASRVIPAYLKIKKPYTITAEDFKVLNRTENYAEAQRKLFNRVRAQGYDGVHFPDHDGGAYTHGSKVPHDVWVTFDSKQVKSSIGNTKFDPNDPNINKYKGDPYVPPDVGLRSVIRGRTEVPASELLDHLISKSQSPFRTAIGKALKAIAGDLKVKISADGMVKADGTPFAGEFQMKTNTIQLHPVYGLNTHTIMHELVHGVTSHFIYNNPDHPATRALDYLTKLARSKEALFGEYATDPGHFRGNMGMEFLAEAMTNGKLQKKLLQMPLTEAEKRAFNNILKGDTVGVHGLRSAWDALKNIFGKVLKIKDDNFLEQAMRVFSNMSDVVSDPKKQVEQFESAKRRSMFNQWENPEMGLPTRNDDPGFYTKMIIGRGISTKEFMKVYAPSVVDIAQRIGMSTASFRSTTGFIKSIGLIDEAAYATMMHLDNQIRAHRAEEHKLNMGNLATSKMVNNLYGLSRLVGPTKAHIELFKKDVGIRLNMEKDPTTWFNGKDYYPTAKQMVEHGMDTESAKVWEEIGKRDDAAWELEVAAQKINGGEIPQRIPGYMRHQWKGPYRVQIVREIEGKEGIAPIEEMNYHSYKEAMAAQKAMDASLVAAGDKSLKSKYIQPEAGSGGAGGMISAMWEATEKIKNQKGLENLLQAIYKSAQQGTLTQMMDRAKLPKSGFMLERAAFQKEGSLFALTHRQMIDAMRSIQQNWEAGSGYYVRAKFVNDVLFPMKEGGYFSHPALEDAAKTYTNAFLKVSDVLEAKVNNKIKDILIAHGQDPGLAGRLANGAMSWASKYYLVFNPAFYAVNLFQATYGASGMLLMKSISQMAGEKHGSILEAMKRSVPDLKAGVKLDMKNELVKYAIENGHSDPVFMEAIDPGAFKDVVSIGLERRTRTNAFITGFHYFNQFMSKEDALVSAGKYADLVGVPYNKQFGAPTWLGQLSYLERPLLMFTTFTQHMWGLMHQQLAVANKARNLGQFEAMKTALQSAATFHTINYALFGITALPLMNNWDSVVKAINAVSGGEWNLPTHQEIARMIDSHLPESMKGISSYGAVSKWGTAGYDISPSGSGPNVQAPAAMFDMLKTNVQILMLGGQWAFTGKPVTKQQVWEIASGLPAKISGVAEWAIKNGSLEFSPTKDIAIQHRMARTEGEQWMRLLTGLRSIDEKEMNASYQISDRHKQVLDDMVKAVVQRGRENGKWDSDDIKLLIKLAQESGKEIGPMIESIVAAQQSKIMSPDMRDAMEATKSLEGMKDYQRIQEQRNLEVDRRR